MESAPEVKNLLYKFSNCSNILPFLGFYDQVYLVFNFLSVKSREVWKQNSNIIKTVILKRNIRIHPYFKEGSQAQLKDIKRVYKHGIHKFFLCPDIEIQPSDLNFEPITKTDFCSEFMFQRLIIQNYSTVQQLTDCVNALKENPSINDSMIKLITTSWQMQNGVPSLKDIERFDYSSNTGMFSIDSMIQQLNDFDLTIRHLTIQHYNTHEKPETQVNDNTKNSVKHVTIRAYDFNIPDMNAFTDNIAASFPNVNKITVESSKDDLPYFIKQFEETGIKDIEEYHNTYYYSQGISEYEVELENALIYVETDAGFIPGKFGYFYFKIGEIETTESIDGKLYLVFQVNCVKIMRNPKQVFPDERASSSRFTKPSSVDQNKRVMFIPALSIIKFNCSVDANNVANKILQLPEILDSLEMCKININISNKLADDSVDVVLPKLSAFELESLNLNLNYTTNDLFDTMMKFLSNISDKSLKDFTIHIFSQSQFEECLRVISNMKSNMQKLSLVLRSEAMLDMRNLIHNIKKAKPFMNLEMHYFAQREETFTVMDLLKKLRAKMQLKENS